MTSSPGSSSAEHRGDHRLGRAAGDGDLVSGSIAPQAGKWSDRRGRDRVAERLGAPGDRVLVDVVVDGRRRPRPSARAGTAKSGKPWARLTAPCCTASRFISRMTDSVKLAALAEMRGRVMPRSLRPSAQTSWRGIRSCQRRSKNRSPSRSTSRSTARSKASASLVWRLRARISIACATSASGRRRRRRGVADGRVAVRRGQPQRLGGVQPAAVLEHVLAAVVDRDRDRAAR